MQYCVALSSVASLIVVDLDLRKSGLTICRERRKGKRKLLRLVLTGRLWDVFSSPLSKFWLYRVKSESWVSRVELRLRHEISDSASLVTENVSSPSTCLS